MAEIYPKTLDKIEKIQKLAFLLNMNKKTVCIYSGTTVHAGAKTEEEKNAETLEIKGEMGYVNRSKTHKNALFRGTLFFVQLYHSRGYKLIFLCGQPLNVVVDKTECTKMQKTPFLWAFSVDFVPFGCYNY